MVNKDRPQDEERMSQEESDRMMASFEEAIADHDQRHYMLRLYVTGATPRSRQAIENLKAVCEIHLQGRYQLEVIDVYQSPSQMQQDNVLAIPTLVKRLPLPMRHIIGDLSNTEKVLIGLDLVPQ